MADSFDALDAKLAAKNAMLLVKSDAMLYGEEGSEEGVCDSDDGEDIHMKRRNIPIGYEAHVDPITRAEVHQWTEAFTFVRVIGKGIGSVSIGGDNKRAVSTTTVVAGGGPSASSDHVDSCRIMDHSLQLSSSSSSSSSKTTTINTPILNYSSTEDVVEEVVIENGFLEENIAIDIQDEAIHFRDKDMDHIRGKNVDEVKCPTDEINEEVNDVVFTEKWHSLVKGSEFDSFVKSIIPSIRDRDSSSAMQISDGGKKESSADSIYEDWSDSD